MKGNAAFLLASLLVLALANTPEPYTSTFIIDTFDNFVAPFQRAEVLRVPGNPAVTMHPYTGEAGVWTYNVQSYNEANTSPLLLGSSRDLIVYLNQNSTTSNGLGSRILVNKNAGDGQLSFSSDQGARGIAEIQWDGTEDMSNPIFFNKAGLGGLDMASVIDAFYIELEATDLPAILRFEAWSYAGGNAAASQGVFLELSPSARDVQSSKLKKREQIFQLARFQGIGDSSIKPLDVFHDIGAMRLFISNAQGVAPSIDLVIKTIQTVSRFCLWKSVAGATRSELPPLFNMFFGRINEVLTADCGSEDAVRPGDRLTYFVQAYADSVLPINALIEDRIPEGFVLDRSNIILFIHDNLTSAQANATVLPAVAGDPNLLQVRYRVSNTVASSRLTIFYQVVVGNVVVDPNECSILKPNQAVLSTNSTVLPSSHWTASERQPGAPTVVCVTGAADYLLGVSFIENSVVTGSEFLASLSYSNRGSVDALGSSLTISVLSGNAAVISAGFGMVNGSYVKNLNTLPANGSPIQDSVRFFTAMPFGDITIQFCISNEGNSLGLPEDCVASHCVTRTITVGGEPNLKLCKSAKLRRKLVWDVDYFNVGDGAARDVIISEYIIPGTEFSVEESDPRWVCDDQECIIYIPVLPSGRAECAKFVLYLLDDTPVCELYENVASIEISPETPEIGIMEDNLAYYAVQQSGCPLQCPEEPECCDCPPPPSPPSPPPMCECTPPPSPPTCSPPPPTCH